MNRLKQCSPDYKSIDITAIQDPALLDVAERRNRAGAMFAAYNPQSLGANLRHLREIRS
jgi:hypothetical protein